MVRRLMSHIGMLGLARMLGLVRMYCRMEVSYVDSYIQIKACRSSCRSLGLSGMLVANEAGW